MYIAFVELVIILFVVVYNINFLLVVTALYIHIRKYVVVIISCQIENIDSPLINHGVDCH